MPVKTPLHRRRVVVAAKIETEIGTPETLAAADAGFNAFESSLSPSIETVAREGQGSLSHLPSVQAGRQGTMSFEVELYEAAPWASILLPACGMVADAGVWTPSSDPTDWKTVTLGRWIGGKLYRLAGAMGNPTFNFVAGRPTRVQFEFQGVWVAPSAESLIEPDFPLSTPPRFAGATLELDSYEPTISQISITLGNAISVHESAHEDAGFYRAFIDTRDVGAEFDPEELLIADHDAHGLWVAGTEAALDLSYSDVGVAIPKLQYRDVQPGERNGAATLDINAQANRDSAAGDDEIEITIGTAS